MKASFFSVAAVVLTVAASSTAFAYDVEREYQIKAAMLYKFTRFFDWEDSGSNYQDNLTRTDGKVSLCLMHTDPFGEFIDRLFDSVNKKSERQFEVKRIASDGNLSPCNIIFFQFDASFEQEFPENTLLITENRSLEDTPYHISFFNEGGNVRFEINITNFRNDGLRISSMLLNLARIVSNKGNT